MGGTAEDVSARGRQAMESLNIAHVSAVGSAALRELEAELIANGDDVSKLSPDLGAQLVIAAETYVEMRKQLTSWIDTEFGMFLSIFEILCTKTLGETNGYSASIDTAMRRLGDVFEPC